MSGMPGGSAAIAGMACAAALLPACGRGGPVAPTKAQLTLRGDLSGVLHTGSPSSCGPGETLVVGIVGDARDAPPVDLRVDSDSSVVLDAGALGVYSGDGVTFRADTGWDVDASLKSGAGRRITVRGHLPC